MAVAKHIKLLLLIWIKEERSKRETVNVLTIYIIWNLLFLCRKIRIGYNIVDDIVEVVGTIWRIKSEVVKVITEK